MKILVQNNQHKHKVDLLKLEGMSKKLAGAVFANFKQKKPKAKWTNYLNRIEQFSTLDLLIVSPQTIKKLNKEWLHKDKATDVLSFPLIDLASTDILKELDHIISANHSDSVEETALVQCGEIFISYEQAIKQAKEYGHSLDRELAFLFVHGLLHIFGFDHQDKKSEKEMFGRQHTILDNSGYCR